jgi:methyltransferase (TIGR00027 family)
VPEPDGLVFVPLDFEQQALVDSLCAAGFRTEQPAFVSWLGTTQYLTADAVFDTLKAVASLAPGSEIVFTYHVPEGTLGASDRRVRQVLSARAARGGTPWISTFEPTTLAARLETPGFAEVVDFGPEQARIRYFTGRTDGLVPPRLSRLMKGRLAAGSG